MEATTSSEAVSNLKKASQCYKNGDIETAIQLLKQQVKQSPSDLQARVFLSELLCLNGDLLKADGQLQSLVVTAPDMMLLVSNWRQLISAAYVREAVYRREATPTLIADATPGIKSAMAKLLSNQNEAGADSQAQKSKDKGLLLVNGEPSEVLLDLDELQGPVLEFLGTNGDYFWIDISQVVSLICHKPERPLDLLWRKCELVTTTGSEGVVFMPAIYPLESSDMQCKLGRATDWRELDGLQRGMGLREFLVGDQFLNVHDLESIENNLGN